MSIEEFDEPERTEQEREKSKRARQVQVDDFLWLMSDKRGRRIMWRLLGETRVFQSSFTGNSQTFFNEGTRNVGLKLLGEINELCPDRYVSMLKENTHDSRNRPRNH